ncbi:MAG: glycosyltransferase, partial [Candidatus Dormibacteraceae bacterium]
MLLQFLLFFAFASATTTLAVLVPGAVRARVWVGLPLGVAALAVAGWLLALVSGGQPAGIATGLLGLASAVVARLLLRRFSWLAAQVLAMVTLGAVAYLVYAAALTYAENLNPAGVAGSTLLLLLEICALTLSLSYAFEILDVLGRRDVATHRFDAAHQPPIALQVPTYNEPVEVVGETLRALAAVDYPSLIVQVVDNNTTDPAVWRPLEDLCARLGPRFQFMHLENWPGFKAGALNEATRRLPHEVQVVGIVDADYLVRSDFARSVAGHFADPTVAFVQTPQDYRDWRDDSYLRGLFYSYRYFFEITMPARAHRDAIIFAGTMGLIRRSVLEEVGGWNTACITEDAEASLRMLGHGYQGVYIPEAYGEGLMPLSFDGLKKQRFRWALGGIQILRQHWRDLLPWGGHRRLHLTRAQRLHYLLGSVQWFGDLLMVLFTALLVLTAITTALHHQLPLRRLTGSVLVVPLVFLLTGLARAVWAMRATTGCTWRDAVRGLQVWFALSWVVSLACMKGLVGSETAFLRTPKQREGGRSWLRAIRACKAETLIFVCGGLAMIAMVARAPSFTTAALGGLLFFQSLVYLNAPWASTAAEGVPLTPLRRLYRYSAQTTGERPGAGRRAVLLPALV